MEEENQEESKEENKENAEVKPELKEEPKKKVTFEEFEKKVLELAESGLTSEKIGENLKKEGIHPKSYDVKISSILKSKGKFVSPDLKNVENKLKKIRTHFDNNKQDKKAMRERERITAKFRKLTNYFKPQKNI